MTAELHLRIATPAQVLIDCDGVRSVRAMDRSGSFGILPRHTDMLTVLPPSVVSWTGTDEVRRYCAVRGGVLTVSDGRDVTIASRHAVLGTSLESLEGVIEEARENEIEADRKARVEQVRFHAQAVRHLVRHLLPQSRQGIATGLPETDWP